MPQNFGALVWANNAFIAAICLASGVLVLPPLLVLWQNALNVGLIGGVMVGAGHGDIFFGLIAPHGLLELTAIFVAAGVGMRMGWAWIAPGPVLTRAQSLAGRRNRAWSARSAWSALARRCWSLRHASPLPLVIEAFVTPAPLPAHRPRRVIGFVIWLAFLAYVWVLGRAIGWMRPQRRPAALRAR